MNMHETLKTEMDLPNNETIVYDNKDKELSNIFRVEQSKAKMRLNSVIPDYRH